MAYRVLIPTPLRPYTDQQDAVEVDGSTVGEVLSSLTARYGELRRHLYSDEGKLRSFVNVYVNDDDIRYLDREATSAEGGRRRQHRPVGRRRRAGRDPETLPELTNAEVQRYSRHLILPEVGPDGQRRLKAGRVLCVGAGGLGSPAALYLAAAGVGTIGIIDFDAVDLSNLQRQILHGTPDVGRSKLQSAKDRLNALNPTVKVESYETALTSKNALELFKRVRHHPRRHRQLLDPLPGQRRLRASSASRTPTAASSGSKGRPRCSPPRAGRAIAASTRSRRRPGSCRAARKAACSACCPA